METTGPRVKRARYEPNEKIKALKFIVALSDSIKPVELMQKRNETPKLDLNVSNHCAGILFSVYSFMRKKANNNQGFNAEHGKRIVHVPGETNTTTIDALVTKFTTENPSFIVDKDLFRVATPIMNMLTAFKLSVDESRLSCSKFTTKKATDTSDAVYCDIKDFGLNRSHIAQCRGITFPPERRTGLLRCMGVGTLLIYLVRERTYKDKIASALKEVTSTVPHSNSYVDCLAKNDSKMLEDIIPQFCSLTNITTDRTHNRIFFPLHLFVSMYHAKEEVVSKADFSGKGGYYLYGMACNSYEFLINTIKRRMGNK